MYAAALIAAAYFWLIEKFIYTQIYLYKNSFMHKCIFLFIKSVMKFENKKTE